ncbi:uncharacterized protein LOC123498844 [Portunus trituberculatus]|uniref:uncharacterized protein LOC123498844 n=1 Tax=Portunus trituberculatus TaxID=210409 RepID=UPI001E1CD4BF|nr:uncharacterized protein LOC123498844 [Portunus trituberculatus]
MDIIWPAGNSERGYMYCLVTDVLTRYLIAEPLKTKKVTEVASVFFDGVVCKHGVPQMLTDQGREFVNSVLQGVAELLQMKYVITTPYHPQANGVIESSNATLRNILRTMVQDNVIKEEKVWYNSDDFKQEMVTKAYRVYARCHQCLEEAKGVAEKRQNKRARIKTLQVRDVRRIPSAGTPYKLQPAYTGPFRILDKINDVVVKVRYIRTGVIKTLHTERKRVIHEDIVTLQMKPNVRRAYPRHET